MIINYLVVQRYNLFFNSAKKRAAIITDAALFYLAYKRFRLLYLSYDSLESLRIVEGEVSEHLAVDLDTSL